MLSLKVCVLGGHRDEPIMNLYQMLKDATRQNARPFQKTKTILKGSNSTGLKKHGQYSITGKIFNARHDPFFFPKLNKPLGKRGNLCVCSLLFSDQEKC